MAKNIDIVGCAVGDSGRSCHSVCGFCIQIGDVLERKGAVMSAKSEPKTVFMTSVVRYRSQAYSVGFHSQIVSLL